mgnify:CR=1 FL=1
MPTKSLLAAKRLAFDPVRHLFDIYKQTIKLKGEAGVSKQVFFSFDAVKAYGGNAVCAVVEARVMRLGESSQVLYDFNWNGEEEGT